MNLSIIQTTQAKTESLDLIQNSFSTILIDAIQYYPNESKKIKEAHGLLFGCRQQGFVECDYVFPVGNVLKRKEY